MASGGLVGTGPGTLRGWSPAPCLLQAQPGCSRWGLPALALHGVVGGTTPLAPSHFSQASSGLGNLLVPCSWDLPTSWHLWEAALGTTAG